MQQIFAIESLPELEAYLKGKPQKPLQAQLGEVFLQHCLYTNAEEWNKAVRLCEALTIVGWGALEPVEATRGKSFNGNPQTAFFNRYSERPFVSAAWSKRKTGFTMQEGDTSYFRSPDLPNQDTLLCNFPTRECIQNIALATQRNWIPKCPVLVKSYTSNDDPRNKAIEAAIKQDLTPALDRQMKPENYGSGLDRIILSYHLSSSYLKLQTNYVVLDEDAKISTQNLYKRLQSLYSVDEIKANGYYLRKRFDFSNFRAAEGLIKVDIHFAREFTDQPLAEQRRAFGEHLITAVNGVASRLASKRLPYDLEIMSHDFRTVVQQWVG